MSAEDMAEMELAAACLEAEGQVQESILMQRRRQFFENAGIPMPDFVKSEEDFQRVLDFIRRQS